MTTVWKIRGKVSKVFCTVLHTSVHSDMHTHANTHAQFLAVTVSYFESFCIFCL